jgi:hypothetical protein
MTRAGYIHPCVVNASDQLIGATGLAVFQCYKYHLQHFNTAEPIANEIYPSKFWQSMQQNRLCLPKQCTVDLLLGVQHGSFTYR